MMANPRWTWTVEGTVPTDSNGRIWNQNFNLQAVASTLQEAVDATVAKYPDMTLHKVWRDRNIKDVIVAPGRGGDDSHG